MANKQWIALSLTVWGVIITTLTGLLPTINSLLGLWFPELSLTPEWIESLDTNVRALINTLGVVVGLVMVIIDRFKISSGETPKSLTFKPSEDKKAKKLLRLN
jgi:hypothetical protein